MPSAPSIRKFFTTLAVLFPLHAIGQELPQVVSRNSEKVIKGDAPIPLVLQLGLDGGALTHSTTIAREGPFTGWFSNGKALASLLFENWILEGGLGLGYSALYGTTRNENPAVPELGHRVYTQSAFGEAGIRFRLTPRFNFGLIAQDFFGTDLTLSQRKDLVNNMFLGGGMAAFDLLRDTGIFRLGLQILAEIPDNSRKVLFYGATLQFGVPLQGYDTLLRKTDVYVRKERVQKIEVPKIITRTVVRDVSKYSLPRDIFHFVRNSTALTPDDQGFVIELANTLRAQVANFKTVTVEAVVKLSSEPRRDQSLSEARAQLIRNALVTAGLPASRVNAVGLGGRSMAEERTTNTQSLTLVELSFTGLSNPDEVTDAINLLLKRRMTPETCKGETCK